MWKLIFDICSSRLNLKYWIKSVLLRYGQEQTKVIKGFQSGKPYESPFTWFPIIVEMLTKVIDDESKLQVKYII